MFKRKLLKHILPMMLSVAMVIQSLPATALAAEYEQVTETEISAEETNDEAQSDEDRQAENSAGTEETTEADNAETGTENAKEQPGTEQTSAETDTAAAETETKTKTETATAASAADTAEDEPAAATETAAAAESAELTEETEAVEETTGTAETETELTEENDELQEGETAEELTLDTKKSFTLEDDDSFAWFKFTAETAGQYIFMVNTDCYTTIILYEDMAGEPSKDLYNSWSSHSNMCNLNAGETIYVKTGGSNSSETGSIQVSKTPERVAGTVSDVNATPYAYYANIKYQVTADEKSDINNLTSYGGFMIAYSENAEADFGKVEAYLRSDYAYNDRADGITIKSNSRKNYSNENGTADFDVDLTGLKPDTTYYYKIFGTAVLDTDDFGEKSFRRACTDILQFKTSASIEQSNVSVAMLTEGTSAGYAQARMEAGITNPDNEYIESQGFHITAAGVNKNDVYGSWKNNSTTEYYRTYQFDAETSEITVTPYVNVKTGAEGTLTEITGTPKTITRKTTPALENLFTVNALTDSIQVMYNFDVENTADRYLYVRYSYKKQGETEYTEGSQYQSISAGNDSTVFSGSFTCSDFEADTAYDVILRLYAGYDKTSLILSEQTVSVTTKENKTYTDADIPDAALRAAIQSAVKSAGASDGALTSANFEKVKYLRLYFSSFTSLGVDSAVKSLEGIQYLENLESISMDYQDIEDISPITTLKNLESISFSYNRIKTIPDLSKMSLLRNVSLNYNEIPASEFDVSKIPAKVDSADWVKQADNQRKKETMNTTDVYPLLGDGTALIYVEIEGMSYQRTWGVKAKIDETEYTLKKEGSYGYLLATKDLQAGTHEITFTAQEDYNGLKLEATKTITIEALKESFEYQKYIQEEDTSISFTVYVPDTTCTPTDAYLVDASDNDKVVAVKTYNINDYNTSLSNRNLLPQTDAFVHGWPSFNNYSCKQIYGTLYFASAPKQSAKYDLIVKTTNKEYRFENYATTSYSAGLVTSVSYSSDHDNSREYFYMTVSGQGLEYDKFYPQLKLEDGTVITEYVSRINDSNYGIYKLKKLDNFVTNKSVPYDLITENGYQLEYSANADKTVYTSSGNDLLYISYNAKTKEYLMYTSAEVPENAEMEILLTEDYPDWNWDTKKWDLNGNTVHATATVTVSGNETKVNFCDENGNFVGIPQNKNWCYAATWKEEDFTQNAHSYIRHTESGFCETGSKASFSVGSELIFKDVKEIPVMFYLTNYEGIAQVGDTVNVTLSQNTVDGAQGIRQTIQLTLEADKDRNDRLVCSGTFTSEENYPVGSYYLRPSCRGVNDGNSGYSSWSVYIGGEETFYMASQYSNVIMYENQTCVQVYFYTPSQGLDESKIKVEFFDVAKQKIESAEQIGTKTYPKSGGYYFYFSGIQENYKVAYVKVTYDGNIGTSLKDTTRSYYAVENDSEEYGDLVSYNTSVYFGYETNIGICKVTNYWSDDYYVDIYNDYDGTLITSINVKNKGVYNFTKADLSAVRQIDPQLNKLYTLTARKGNFIYTTSRSCNIGYTGMENDNWSYTIGKTTLAIGDTTTITVTGSKEAPAFKSSDEKVFTVTADSADKNKAVITAVGEGIAELLLTVDGETENIAITVQKEIIAPTGIALNKTELSIGAGATAELRATFEPVGAVGEVSFTTSDEKVVQIESTKTATDGVTATLLAVAPGEAVVTASVKETDFRAECKVTVQGTYTDEDKENEIAKVGTLYAVTNETATLGEVALPAGWSWKDNVKTRKLEALDSMPVQKFAAVYTREGYESINAMLPVAVTEIAEIQISGSSEITQEEVQSYTIALTSKGYQYADAQNLAEMKANIRFAWSSTGTNLVLAETDKPVVSATAKKVQAAAEEELSVTMTIGAAELKASQKITVLPEHIGNIVITPKADGKTSIYKNNAVYASPDAGEITLDISATKNGAAIEVKKGTFQWTSADDSIAAVTEQENGSAVLKIGSAGVTSVTAKANDEIGKTCELFVYVGEFTPVLESSKLTLNAYSEDGVVIPLHENSGNSITEVKLSGSSNFSVKKNANGEFALLVTAGKEEAAEKKATVKFTAVTEIGKNLDGELTVTVNKKLPKVTFKATQKANTFFKNAQAVYKVSADDEIENITTDATASYTVSDYNAASQTLKLERKGTDASTTLKVKMEGYKEISQTLKVASQTKKPPYTIDEMYLVEGQLSDTTRVMENKKKKVVLTNDIKAESLTAGVTAGISNGLLALTLASAGKKSVSYQVKLSCDNWSAPLTLKGKISIGKEPDQLMVSESKVTINNAYSSAEYGTVDIDTYVKNSTKQLDSVTITPEVTGMSVVFDKAEQKIAISYNGTQLSAGNYKFTLKGVIDGTKALKKAATVTVTVADSAKKKAQVKLSGKGSINLVDRAGTSIIYTAKLSNISGTVAGAELVDSDYSDNFTVSVTEDGKIELQAVQGVSMQTKNPYLLQFKVRLNNGIVLTSPEVKVKVANKPPKAKASATKATMYKLSGSRAFWLVTSGNCKISSMELVKDKKNISDNFVLTSSGRYASLTLKDSAKKTLPAGKYSISYKVTMEGQSTDAKDVILKMTVTVK